MQMTLDMFLGGGSSPFDPTSLKSVETYGGVGLWVLPTDSDSITSSGTNLTMVSDRSSNGRDMTAINNPQYDGASIEFNGTNNYMFSTDPFMFDSGATTIFMVVEDADDGDTILLAESNNTDNDPLYIPIASTIGNDNLRILFRDDTNPIDIFDLEGAYFDGTSKKIITVRDDGSNVTVWENGILIKTQAYTRGGTTTLNSLNVGANIRTTVAGYASFKLHELLIYEESLSNAAVNAVHNNIILPKHFTEVDTFLLTGQSNADGRGSNSNLDSTVSTFYNSDRPNLNVYYKPATRDDAQVSNLTSGSFADDGEWWQLHKTHDSGNSKTHQTIGFPSSTVATQSASRHGAEVVYGYEFAQENPSDELWVIKAAVSNTGITDDWKVVAADTDGTWYWALTYVINPALIKMRDQGKTPKKNSLLFDMQGETDTTSSGLANVFEANKQIFIDRITDDIPTLVDTNIILGGLSATYDGGNGATVKAAQISLADDNSHVGIIHTDSNNPNGAYALQGDNIHYSADGLKEMAEDIFGYDTASLTRSVPAAVSDLSGIGTSGQVSLTWSKPLQNGNTITGYTVQYKETSVGTWTTFSTVTELTDAVTGLTNDTSYDFRVFAINDKGTSPASNIEAATPVDVITPESGAQGHWVFGTDNVALEDLVSSSALTPVNSTPTNSAGYLTTVAEVQNGVESVYGANETDITITAVFRVPTGVSDTIIAGNIGFSLGAAFYLSSNNLQFNVRGGSNAELQAGLTKDVWHFAALTIEGGVTRIDYLGNSGGATSATRVGGFNNVTSGGHGAGNVGYPSGFNEACDIAEFIIWDEAKTLSELDDIYDRSVARMGGRGLSVE